MAIYTCTTQEGTLSEQQRGVIAKEITRIHSTHTGEPASFVWVLFETLPPNRIYAGGKPAVNALIVANAFRERSPELKAQVMKELWAMYQKVTGLPVDHLWVSLTEIAPSDGMFLGAILPEIGHEAEWLAQLGTAG